MSRVLIVEDDEAMAVALRDGFTYEGHEVTVARDGEAGLTSGAHQVETGVANQRCTGIRYQRNILAARQFLQQPVGDITFVMFMHGPQCGTNTVMRQ